MVEVEQFISERTHKPNTLKFWVVCGVKVFCGPEALTHDISPELSQTPQQIE
jgi:hypothetical protein